MYMQQCFTNNKLYVGSRLKTHKKYKEEKKRKTKQSLIEKEQKKTECKYSNTKYML